MDTPMMIAADSGIAEIAVFRDGGHIWIEQPRGDGTTDLVDMTVWQAMMLIGQISEVVNKADDKNQYEEMMGTPEIGKLVEFQKAGKTAWLDMVDGKFAFGGDLEPTEAAKLFLDVLGQLLDQRVARDYLKSKT